MANNIFERYGIKEVANVYFEALKDAEDGSYAMGDIVLYLDTLKVSTIETTAENSSAQGGWGNPKLVTWDYGKDINVTLEDAVISWEEMSILLGAEKKNATDSAPLSIRKSAQHNYKSDTNLKWPVSNVHEDKKGLTVEGVHQFPEASAMTGKAVRFMDLTNGVRGSVAVNADGSMNFTRTDEKESSGEYKAYEPKMVEGALRIRFFWEDTTTEEAKNAVELTISPSRFPDTYKVIGDALIRSEKNNMDEAFQFVISKAKLLSEVTLTMQAEGEPSTFSMTLNVLRDPDGNMMSLIKY